MTIVWPCESRRRLLRHNVRAWITNGLRVKSTIGILRSRESNGTRAFLENRSRRAARTKPGDYNILLLLLLFTVEFVTEEAAEIAKHTQTRAFEFIRRAVHATLRSSSLLSHGGDTRIRSSRKVSKAFPSLERSKAFRASVGHFRFESFDFDFSKARRTRSKRLCEFPALVFPRRRRSSILFSDFSVPNGSR